MCWLRSLIHREAVSALLLMGEMCMSWPQAEVFESHRCQLYGNIWCMYSALWVGDGKQCQLEEPTGTFHQPRLWHSFVGHKCSKPSHLELQDSCGSPRDPDMDFTLASMQAFPLVYSHCKIMHRPEDSASVCLSPGSLFHLAQSFENTT